MPHKPKELREATLSTAAAYVASGIDPKRSAIFVQSQVPQHAQLAWLLTTQCPMTWLNGMTQFQDKKKRNSARTEKKRSELACTLIQCSWRRTSFSTGRTRCQSERTKRSTSSWQTSSRNV